MALYNQYPFGYQPYNPGAFYQQPQNAQLMTPPTIRAEIIQVENEQAALSYPVGAGSSQMMMAKDDSAIFIKTATPNGQAKLDVYVRRPPEPAVRPLDPSEYVTKAELDARLSALLNASAEAKKPSDGGAAQ